MLRIFPLYYVALLLLLVIIPAVAPMALSSPRDGRISPLWFWSYLVNWPIAARGWLVVSPATGQFWTLAIEEQFYLIWPAVVLLVPRERLARVAGLLIALGIVLRYALRHHYPTLILPGAATFTRADGLLLGAILAIWWDSPEWARWRRWPAACLVLSLIALLIIRAVHGNIDDNAPQIVRLTLIALFFASAVAMRTGARTRAEAAPVGRRRGRSDFLGRYSCTPCTYGICRSSSS